MADLFIVTVNDRPMELSHYQDAPRGGVLLQGDTATGFQTYDRARHALLRSRKYAERAGLSWDVVMQWKCQIVRVKVQG